MFTDVFGAGDISAFLVTLKLALLSSGILLLIAIPLAWWLARSEWRYKFLLEAIIALPLVLPPTVLGFYLLLFLGPNGPLAPIFAWFDIRTLAFSFSGLVVASVFYSLPFAFQPLQNSFSAIGQRPLEVAATLGASRVDAFFSVILPLAKPGLVSAAVLSFAHTLGEFGVVLMIGGNIDGETRVLSMAIYEHVEAGEYAQAHGLSLVLLVFSLLMLLGIYAFNKRHQVVL